MHPDGVAEIVYTVVPDMLHQLFLTHRTSLMYHQVFQNAGFLTCKREALSLYAGSSCTCIEGQIFAGKKYILLGELPQGQAADPRFQFCQVKGLGQIVVGSGIQSGHLILHSTPGREDQNPRFVVSLP